jgi:hypothetical protein
MMADELEEFWEEMVRDDRTPEQKAHSVGFTEGYLACEAEQRRKAGLLEKYAETPIQLLWAKMRAEHLNEEEAIRVWQEVRLTVESHHTDGSTLLMLYDILSKELAVGERCAVCARYKNSGCWEEC